MLLELEQMLTILFELETVKEGWQILMLERDLGHETFEQAIERFCSEAQLGGIDGSYYFRDECGCFYGHLFPKAQYDNYATAGHLIDCAAASLSRDVARKIYQDPALADETTHYRRTYIERLLSDDFYNIEEGTTIYIDGKESDFLRELYCLCYQYCSEAWCAANPLSEELATLSAEQRALTEGMRIAPVCGY